MDPKRLQIKTMKTTEAILLSLARIEAHLGIGASQDAPPQVVPFVQASAEPEAVPRKGKAGG